MGLWWASLKLEPFEEHINVEPSVSIYEEGWRKFVFVAGPFITTLEFRVSMHAVKLKSLLLKRLSRL